jgi:hypothetical protein
MADQRNAAGTLHRSFASLRMTNCFYFRSPLASPVPVATVSMFGGV